MKKRFFDDLFSADRSLWLKMAGGAVAAPICAFGAFQRADRKSAELNFSPELFVTVLVGASICGALVGAALTAKDVVRRRMAACEPCPFILKMLFGWGVGSLIIWFLLIIVGTLVITLTALSLAR